MPKALPAERAGRLEAVGRLRRAAHRRIHTATSMDIYRGLPGGRPPSPAGLQPARRPRRGPLLGAGALDGSPLAQPHQLPSEGDLWAAGQAQAEAASSTSGSASQARVYLGESPAPPRHVQGRGQCPSEDYCGPPLHRPRREAPEPHRHGEGVSQVAEEVRFAGSPAVLMWSLRPRGRRRPDGGRGLPRWRWAPNAAPGRDFEG